MRNRDAAGVYDMNRVIGDSVDQGIITPEQGSRATLRNIQYGITDPLDPNAPPFEGIFDDPSWVTQFRSRWTEFRQRLVG
jgi:hypothetical protein